MNGDNENASSGDTSANQAQTRPNAPSEPLATGLAVDQKPKPEGEAGDTGKSATEAQKETLAAIKKGEIVGLIIAGVVAFGTIGQWVTNSCNNSSSSQQTDKLIVAARLNSLAAQDIAEASRRNAISAEHFSNSASSINGGIGDAVRKLGEQADKMVDANKINRESLVIAQRAFVYMDGFDVFPIKDASEKVTGYTFYARWENTGNTPAYHFIHFEDNNWFSMPIYLFPEYSLPAAPPGVLEKVKQFPGVIAPHATLNGRPATRTLLEMQAVDKVPPLYFYFWGWATYNDSFQCPHRSEYCNRAISFDPSRTDHQVTFLQCEEHNCNDRDCKDFKPSTDPKCVP